MEFKDRSRELLTKPSFSGVPISWATKYLNGRVKKFREEHHEFDSYLKEVENLIKKENLHYLDNLILFLTYKGESNWISPKDSIFDLFIKLFNYDLSPKQTLYYIKKAYEIYVFLTKNTYILDNEYEVSNERSRWGSKIRRFIKVYLKPLHKLKEDNSGYYFSIKFGSLSIDDPINDFSVKVDTSIEVISNNEFIKDSLVLFEHYQYKEFYTNLFNFTIKELTSKGIIKELSVKEYVGYLGHRYRIKGDIGYNKIDDKD